jgi:hypothetical protein
MEMLHYGTDGDDLELIEYVDQCLTPDASELYLPISEDDRQRILFPPKKATTSTSESFVPIPQSEEDVFKILRTPKRNVSGLFADDAIPERSRPASPVTPIRSPPPNGEPEDPAPPEEQYILPRKWYRIMPHLYSEAGRAEGQMTFQDLSRVMAAAGFGRLPSGGSAYLFFKAAADGRPARSITFHDIHPRSHYEGNELRGIGWRLADRFGWSAGTFVEQTN